MKRSIFISIVLSCVVVSPPPTCAQTPDRPQLLYGTAYYHEYMPTERLDKDVELMQAAHLNVVRMGESTWSLWEPEDGRFEYAWMDRVVDAMGKAGIKVISAYEEIARTAKESEAS
jgi:beta-galactosidase